MSDWLILHRIPITVGLLLAMLMALLGWLDAEITSRRSGHATLKVILGFATPVALAGGLYFGAVGWGVLGWSTMLAYAMISMLLASMCFGAASGWAIDCQPPAEDRTDRPWPGHDYSNLPSI